MIKNSQSFGKRDRKPQGGFFDSHCINWFTNSNTKQNKSKFYNLMLAIYRQQYISISAGGLGDNFVHRSVEKYEHKLN